MASFADLPRAGPDHPLPPAAWREGRETQLQQFPRAPLQGCARPAPLATGEERAEFTVDLSVQIVVDACDDRPVERELIADDGPGFGGRRGGPQVSRILLDPTRQQPEEVIEIAGG